MADDRNQQPRKLARQRIRWTVALLAGLAALIYLGFIGRGVFG
ncbi:MAG: hypothetical protein WD397_12235 [Wenzhouxiangellaceae bacterium]